MTGKLKIEGDMGKAMKLDKLMSSMGQQQTRGLHTWRQQHSIYPFKCTFSTEAEEFADGPQYMTVAEIFKNLKQVASEDVVERVGATLLFEVPGEGAYFVDLKHGDGGVLKLTKGQTPPEMPDVTVRVKKDVIIKIFNREVRASSAFMEGQLKLAGDVQKAVAFEEVVKANRLKKAGLAPTTPSPPATPPQQASGRAGLHTSAAHAAAADAPPATYSSVPEVFDRIKKVRREKSQVFYSIHVTILCRSATRRLWSR